ncbi:MAG: TIGR04283 family arsenosugar biosynthesis glycosyltransferase [Desulfobacterales bacterium]
MSAAGLGGRRISVIVPALNEAEGIMDAIEDARAGEDVEVIVVDGGSSDDTVSMVRKAGVRLIESPKGRGRQMNAGAAAASGGTLLFLHADTRLPRRFDRAVRRALRDPSVAAGAFSLRIDAPGIGLRLVEWGANRRSRTLGRPYGDQALFLSARIFHELGGYPEIPIMEDYALIRRLSRYGRVVTLRQPVRTSARRWRRLGVLQTTLRNQLIIAGYRLGVSPDTLARWYRMGGLQDR